MNKYVILADVTCDLSREIREHFGIEDYIRGHIHFSDGRDFQTTLDWDHIGREDFYKALSDKKTEISTAPASPEEYYTIFRKYAEQGIDILSMSISSKISSTYNVAKQAADRVVAEFPQRKIYCFDSYKMCGAFGLLVIFAHRLKGEGRSFEDVIAALEKGDTYGYRITQELAKGIGASESTLYPVLRRLQKDGCLAAYDVAISGRNRRYYTLTDRGREALDAYRREWVEYKRRMDELLTPSTAKEDEHDAQ